MPIISRCLALGTAALVSACVYVPRATLIYDDGCRAMVRHMVLEGGQVAAIQRCENQGCIALIVGAGVVTAATVLVSGSIVVIGNMASWLERKALCRPAPDASPDPRARHAALSDSAPGRVAATMTSTRNPQEPP
jgi:hypothetical protein